MKFDYSPQIFEKYSNIKFHEHTSSGRRGVACGQTDMTKPTVDVRNFANEVKNNYINIYTYTHTHTHTHTHTYMGARGSAVG